MRRTPSRPGSSRQGANLSSPRDSRYRTPPYSGNTNGRTIQRTPRNQYTDLDRVYQSSETFSRQIKQYDEGPQPRVRHQPEGFLTDDNSSFAMKKLPKATEPQAGAAEESILKKWEAWSTQMGTQLALESAVPTTPMVRPPSRNGSFRSVSQLSNNSLPRPRPESARDFSPLSQSGRRSASRCSSRSRQSSLGSTVVEPFRVGDRMTASAERKRHRPQSTKGSRELLFRRALGLEDDKNTVQNSSMTSAPRRMAPSAAPLIAPARGDSTPRRVADTSRSMPAEKRATEAPPPPPAETVKVVAKEPVPTEAKGSPKATAAAAAPPTETPPPEPILSRAEENAKGDDDDGEWLKKSIALLNTKDQPFTEVFAEQATPVREQPSSAAPETKAVATEQPKAKWHLPVGEAAQMICGRTKTENILDCPTPVFRYLVAGSDDGVDPDIKLTPQDDAIPPWVKWPIDRDSVKVIFVEHHEDDDQLSAYGVEISPREVCLPEVLPDWNESRRRFAPAPIEDAQPPR